MALADGMHFEIGPYQVAVIETFETLNLPHFLIGRWNIRVQLAYLGLLWVGGAQVDPGFRGQLCCPIYNLSTEPVSLKFKDRLAMIDFVTTTRFNHRRQEKFDWQGRKMLVFDQYPLLSSGIKKRVDDFQNQIAEHRTTVSDKITGIEKETTKSFQDIGTRVDTFVVIMFTVVAVLFAGLGIIATKSSESSFVAASVSLVVIAAIALYFALKPYYLISKLQKSLPGQADDSMARSIVALSALLKVGWREGVLALLFVLAGVTVDAWSVYEVRGSATNAIQAKTFGNQAIQNTNAHKLQLEEKLKALREQNDAKIENLEKEIRFLEKTKKDK
jgi:dUTPase/gas vesicle protein